MNIASLRLRRLITVVGVIAALALGFGSIKAAAAWTAASAPLTVTPVSVAAIQDRLVAEQTRSADMAARLESLAGQSAELTAALETAQARIVADTDQAKVLARALAAAKKKLAKLEASIAKARKATRRQVVMTRTKTVMSAGSTTRHGGDDEGGDDEGGDDSVAAAGASGGPRRRVCGCVHLLAGGGDRAPVCDGRAHRGRSRARRPRRDILGDGPTNWKPRSIKRRAPIRPPPGGTGACASAG